MNLRTLVFVLACAITSAQNQDTLTNETIMRMAVAGVPTSAIIQTINAASSVAFRFLPGDFTAMNQAKVPDEVIKAMAARANDRTTPAPVVPAQVSTPVAVAAPQPQVPVVVPAKVPPAQPVSNAPQQVLPAAHVAALTLAKTTVSHGGSPRIYIEPQNGFESYISAAIVKKHVPAVATQNRDEAEYFLTSVVDAKEESTGSKVARCLFLYCIGLEGNQTATVQLVNAKTQEVAWAYNVRKGSASAYQSTAEAIAKHMKDFLEKHPQ